MRKRKEKEINDQDVIKSLPHDRKEVFLDLILHHKMKLFSLSCFTFMFFIPLAVDLFFFNYLESIAITNQLYEHLFSLVFYSMAIMIPCMILGFLGFAGAFYAMKKMVWQEDVTVAADFFQGIKESGVRALINGLLFGIALFGLVVGCSYLIIFMKDSPIWCGVGIGALILVFILLGLVTTLNFTQDAYYKNKYLATMKNSFLFVGLINWKLLLVFLLTTGSVIALCVFNFITITIGLLLFAVLNSVVVAVYTLISHSAFDKYVNKEHHPEMVGKGLYKIVENDTEKKEA